jgi:hypothetical protein
MSAATERISLWDHAPLVVSLLDIMDKLAPELFGGAFLSLTRAELIVLTYGSKPVPKTTLSNIKDIVLVGLIAFCEQAGLAESSKACARTQQSLEKAKSGEALAENIISLKGLIKSEMSKRLMFVVENGRENYWCNSELFGRQVLNSFPSASMDIHEAGNFWVAGRNNAVIYHLMCAAEVGLRVLAADRRVEISNRNGNDTPLELSQWGDLIKGLRKSLDKIQLWSASQKREDALAFYNQALIEAQSFNDGWRRHVMHARAKAYQDDEVQALMGHVRRFLQTLASRISETNLMPEIWP